MTQILEVDEQGALYLPPELLGDVPPHTRFVVEVQGNTLTLRPQQSAPFWATATPQERANAFLRWASRERPKAPPLSDEALSRESLYE
jgi:hypothetical protein